MIDKIEKHAQEFNIPIMQKDGIDFLTNYIKEHNIINILEIGTATGYSSIKMALVNDRILITTIEKDQSRYEEAVKNIKNMHLEKQITPLLADALEVNLLDQKYDLIFIDAAKGKYIDFFNLFSSHLNDNGVIVTDNIDFHGLVKDDKLIKTKNQRKIVEKIQKYIEFLNSNQEYITSYYPIGDGITISSKGENKNEITS